MTTLKCTIENIADPGRVIGFCGGQRKPLGVTLKPGEIQEISYAQAVAIRADRTFAHYASRGDVRMVGFDPALVPTAPAVPQAAPGASPSPQAQKRIADAVAAHAAPAKGSAGTLVGFSEADALAAIEIETDMSTLRDWYLADARETIKSAAQVRAVKLHEQKPSAVV